MLLEGTLQKFSSFTDEQVKFKEAICLKPHSPRTETENMAGAHPSSPLFYVS